MKTCRYAFALLAAVPVLAQPQQTVDSQQRLEWWTQARFGMFIHWGIYTVPAGEWNGQPVRGLGEWIMNRGKIPVRDYEKLAAIVATAPITPHRTMENNSDPNRKSYVIMR